MNSPGTTQHPANSRPVNGLTDRSVTVGNGITLSIVRDSDRRVVSATETERTVAADPNIQTITKRDGLGNITTVESIAASRDEENNPLANAYDIIRRDGTGVILAIGTRLVIGIDLNGDGLGTIAKAGSSIYFDIDGTADLAAKLQGINAPHYLKHTGWLNNQDGLLILDKNINGTIDNGEEMFSNSMVNEQSRGIASLAVIDADGNGSIDANDPVYGSLRVWQDKNSNGLLDTAEVKTLDALGISSLNYQVGTATRNGQANQLSTLTLDADTLGTSYTPKGDGIQVSSTNGQSTSYVTQVHDLSSLQANQDGFMTVQNVPAVIAVKHGVNGCYRKRSWLRLFLKGCGPKRLLKCAGNRSHRVLNSSAKSICVEVGLGSFEPKTTKEST